LYASSKLDNIIDRLPSSELDELPNESTFFECEDSLPADAFCECEDAPFCIASDSIEEDWGFLCATETEMKQNKID
jgi:hypothetical protein